LRARPALLLPLQVVVGLVLQVLLLVGWEAPLCHSHRQTLLAAALVLLLLLLRVLLLLLRRLLEPLHCPAPAAGMQHHGWPAHHSAQLAAAAAAVLL